MILSAKEARDVVRDDHEDWEKIESSVISNSRWEVHKKGVFKHIPTNKHYLVHWDIGATEMQDTRPFEYVDEVEFVEVEEQEVIVKKKVILCLHPWVVV